MQSEEEGVQQDYLEAAKWFLTAAEAGNTRAAANYVGALRSGTGKLRTDPELSARWRQIPAGASRIFSGPWKVTAGGSLSLLLSGIVDIFRM